MNCRLSWTNTGYFTLVYNSELEGASLAVWGIYPSELQDMLNLAEKAETNDFHFEFKDTNGNLVEINSPVGDFSATRMNFRNTFDNWRIQSAMKEKYEQ